MTITPTTLTRGAAAAAVAAGAIFIGVNVGHPHLDAESVVTTEVVVRGSLKVLMASLALVAITGMYLRQVRKSGVLGLVGYLVLGAGYLLIMNVAFMASYVLPGMAESDPAYVNDVIAAATGGSPDGDIGLLQSMIRAQDIGYLAGGLVFGIALYRARVLARWACALLAVSGVVSAALSVMPDALYRLLAFPNGIAMIGLGYSLWATTRPANTDTTSVSDAFGSSPVATAGAE